VKTFGGSPRLTISIGTKKPIRNSLDVQVMATPKGNRKVNVGVTPSVYRNRSRLFEGPKPVPSLKEQYIPQSATQASVSQSAPLTRQPLQPSVQDTPSRVRPRDGCADTQSTIGPTVSFPVTPSYRHLPSKDSHLEFKDSDSSCENELENPIEAIANNQGNRLVGFRSDVWAAASTGVQGTPLKCVESNARARTGAGVKETPIKEARKSGMGEALSTDKGTSIYEVLGWDEEDDFV
jgi:DNA replication regulator SLD3